jgi:predicted amidohydrolase YtcJ
MTLQHRVQDVLDELVATGAETGLQVAVHHWGDRVVDAVAGVADGTTGQPVTRSSVSPPPRAWPR